MNDRQYYNAAEEIMALVDENPSELFSLERKFFIERLKSKLEHFYGVCEDHLDGSYQVGYDLGYDEGKEETASEYESRIDELEEEVEELRQDLEDMNSKIDQAFADGYQTAAQDDKIVETLKFE